ncbi:MAG: NUDIX domain-containing protein [Bacillota bacterium]|nr:NUDIX domain-containing protein [Bacillota bacterium]
MNFNYGLGIQEIDKEKISLNINHREAVRAIILRDNNILMVHTNKGDYKFPGGGALEEEGHEQTLNREVREETGHIVNNVKGIVGIVTERHIDEYDENSIFEMVSSYYMCEVSDSKTTQQLDDYESELNFQPVWVLLDEAIKVNEEILSKNDVNTNSWVLRETTVLKAIKEI